MLASTLCASSLEVWMEAISGCQGGLTIGEAAPFLKFVQPCAPVSQVQIELISSSNDGKLARTWIFEPKTAFLWFLQSLK
jgi:hypothetical protein